LSDTQLIGNEFVLIKASEVRAQKVDWLWSNRVPRGEITLLEGDPGVGKSMLTAALAAAVTSGQALPGDDPTEPGTCIMASLEDHHGVVIQPRLTAAGADLSLTLFPDMHDVHQWARPLRLPEDLSRIDEMIQMTQARLLIIDPLMAVLGRDINSDRDQDVREALGPLAEIARPVGTAVVIVRHLNKAVGKSAIYRGGGSIGIGGLARSALMLSRHPHERERIILTQTKSNLGARAKAIVMSIASEDGVGRVVFEGEEDLTSDDVLSEQAKANPRATAKVTRRSEMKAWLEQVLEGGPRAAKEVEALAKAEGFPPTSLRKARQELGVIPRKVGSGQGSEWHWVLDRRVTLQEDREDTAGDQLDHLGELGHVGHHSPAEENTESLPDDSSELVSVKVDQDVQADQGDDGVTDGHLRHGPVKQPSDLLDSSLRSAPTRKLITAYGWEEREPIGPDGERCPDCTIAPAPGQDRCWPCRRRLE
jgi:hypothetical protein